MATTQLHKISYPGLTPSNFGENLRKAFENIDSNFQKLASLGLTTGESGTPAVWVPYNLNSVFCKVSADVFTSDYLNRVHIKAIDKSFVEYNKITDHSREQYIEECRELYKQLIKGLPDDSVEVTSGSGESEKKWRHKWELISNNVYIFDKLSDQSYNDTLKKYIGYTKDGKYIEGDYLNFLPGDILVAGNYDAETKAFTKLSTTAHIYIDPRFRNPMTIAGDVNTESISNATDCSCVVYGKLDNDDFKFEYVYAFPRIHYKDGEFYLSANGIDTNIPLTGRPGESGKNAQFAAVQIKDVEEYYGQINGIVYGSSSGSTEGSTEGSIEGSPENSSSSSTESSTDSTESSTTPIDKDEKIFEIGNKIGSKDPISNPELLDGCPALIFPPAGYTANAYVTLYWVGYLKYDNDTLTAYCGRENLVVVDLYEHSFGGMMMGLDMYEKSIARPVGNTPWTKPRGLMLPIGARYIGAERNGYWDPYYMGDPNDPNYNPAVNFAAHLIYSEGGEGGEESKDYQQKYNLHISSVKDYRQFGLADDKDKYNHSPKPEDLVTPISNDEISSPGVHLFIDEPVTITNYGSSDPTENTLFTNMGSSEIKGNETISKNLNVGENGTIGGDLGVTGDGTIGGNLEVGTDGNKNNGKITANRFERRSAQSGQLLLANGDSTATSPIKIKNSDMGSQEANFSLEPSAGGDGSHYFLGDIKNLIPKMTLEKSSYSTRYNGDIYTFNLTHLLYGGERRLAILHVDLSLGGEQGVNTVSAYENGVKPIATLLSASLTNYQNPPYKIWNFIGSTNSNGSIDDDDAQMGIWFSLEGNTLTCERCNHPGRLGGNKFSMDFIYPLGGELVTYYWALGYEPQANNNIEEDGKTNIPSAPSGVSTWWLVSASQEYTGPMPPSPTVYKASGWQWSCTKQQEDIVIPKYKHYWKINHSLSSSDPLGTDSQYQYSASNPNPGWDAQATAPWYLVTLTSTEQTLPSSGAINYGSIGSSDWGTNWSSTVSDIWSCKIQTPSNITYRWMGPDIGATQADFETYLTQTILLYKDNGNWTGSIYKVISQEVTHYERFEGAHGTVSISRYKEGNIWKTELTIEAWNKTLTKILEFSRTLSLSPASPTGALTIGQISNLNS